MAIPTTRTEFKDYCLRKLGYPVIEINVADTQIDDRIDEALQLFQMFHGEAVERVFMTHTLTEQERTQKYITIVEPVISILRVLWAGAGVNSGDFASGLWQYKFDVFSSYGFKGPGYADLSGYYISMSHLSDINMTLGNYPRINYKMHSNKLFIDDDWSNFDVGGDFMYEAYVAIDPDTYTNVWNDVWLKDYGTALIGRQWGENLQKFEQVELPGGIILNGTVIYDKFNERIAKLEEDLDNRWSEPADFMVG